MQGVSKCQIRDCSIFALILHQSMAHYWPYTKAWHATDLTPKHGTLLTLHQSMAHHWPYTKAWHTTDLTPKHGTPLTLHQSMAHYWPYTKAWHATDLAPKHGTLLTLHQSTRATVLTPKYDTLLTLHQSMAHYWPYTEAWYATDLILKYARYWTYTEAWHATDLTPKYTCYWPYTEAWHATDLIPKYARYWPYTKVRALLILRQSMPCYSTPRTLNNVNILCSHCGFSEYLSNFGCDTFSTGKCLPVYYALQPNIPQRICFLAVWYIYWCYEMWFGVNGIQSLVRPLELKLSFRFQTYS